MHVDYADVPAFLQRHGRVYKEKRNELLIQQLKS
jgi:hypothetical protein